MECGASRHQGGERAGQQLPDCSAWSFSVTKAYSAAVRAGTILFKKDTNMATAVDDIAGMLSSFSYGLYSEYSVFGQIQIYDMMMSRPLASPGSWIGAYSELMSEKTQFRKSKEL